MLVCLACTLTDKGYGSDSYSFYVLDTDSGEVEKLRSKFLISAIEHGAQINGLSLINNELSAVCPSLDTVEGVSWSFKSLGGFIVSLANYRTRSGGTSYSRVFLCNTNTGESEEVDFCESARGRTRAVFTSSCTANKAEVLLRHIDDEFIYERRTDIAHISIGNKVRIRRDKNIKIRRIGLFSRRRFH